MSGKVLNLKDVISPDLLACRISNFWMEWNMLRQGKLAAWEEVRKYIFATDTTTTTNSKLPWKNKTTVPKICQIRDNLNANYTASLFPNRSWYDWLADHENSNSLDKRQTVLNLMRYATSQPQFKTEMSKCILDYIDTGNAICKIDWLDQRQTLPDGRTKVGYVGPVPRRISPYDIVCNPTAPSWFESPKIERIVTSFGEVKGILESNTTDENRDEMEKLWEYLKGVRTTIQNSASDFKSVDDFYRVDGFTSFRAYMMSDFVEILTFYGDLYNWETGEFLKNHQIMVVDRHKIIGKKPNPSWFGYPPIFHAGWRPRQDNLWAMGPLENLIGMQYRIDHVENLKADVFDLITFPPLKIKGYVEDFDYAPLERIKMGDDGDVQMMAPPFQILQANIEIDSYANRMEEMAGSPKEAAGFRTPGEKTAYEVQQLQNAAARIFQDKITQFEEQFVEPVLNGMLEKYRRNISEAITIPVMDDEFNYQTFVSLSPQDITGAGRIKPVAARHFVERAQLVQNLTSFYSSAIGKDPAVLAHWSGLKTAKLMETALNVEDYHLVQENVRVAEQADTQRMVQAAQQQVGVEGQTPSGLTPDDYDQTKTPQITTQRAQAAAPQTQTQNNSQQ